jgi:hypothetical protein
MAQSRLITDLVELIQPNNDDIFVIVDNTSDPTLSVTKRISYANLKESLQDMIDVLFSAGNGVDLTYDDTGNTVTITVLPDTTVQKSIYSNSGTTVGTRQQLNVVPGAGVTISGVDNPAANRVDLTLNTTNVSTATNLAANGSHATIIQAVNTLVDGTKDVRVRSIEAASTKVVVATGSTGNSVSLDVDPSQININSLQVGQPLAVALGGTNATTASAARASLGAAARGDNSDITSITGLTTALSIDQGGTAGTTAQAGLFNLEGVSSAVNVGSTGQSLIVNGKSAVAGEYRVELKSIRPGSSKASVTTVGQEIVVDVNANNVLNAASQNVNLNNFRITNLAPPISANDAATKEYADSVAQGLTLKEACVAASTSNFSGTYFNTSGAVSAVDTGADTFTINNHGFNTGERVYISSTGTIPGGVSAGVEYFVINTGVNSVQLASSSANAAGGTQIDITSTGSGTITIAHTLYLLAGANGALSLDGVTIAQGDRVLIKNQTTATQNGIYVATDEGAVNRPAVLTRAEDANTSVELAAGSFTFIVDGTTQGGIAYVQVADAPILDVDAINWTVFSSSAIAPNSIGNDRLVQVAQATIKGRSAAAGTGDVQDLTANQVVTIVNTATTAIDCGTY